MNLETYDLFSRQVPFLGEENQDKLSKAKAVVVGAGGLGSYVASMLVRAGIGFVRVIDRDLVEESNLHRTMIYERKDIGKSKAFIVKARLMDINRETRIHDVSENLYQGNAEKLLAGFNVVVDCTDNMESRYLINKTCFENKIPWIYGSAIRDEGFSSTFAPNGNPCFSCLYPRKPKPGSIPVCNVEGVVSPIIGMIASWQVMEVVKIITGIGKPNSSKLLRITLKDPKLEFLNVKPKKDCEVCS